MDNQVYYNIKNSLIEDKKNKDERAIDVARSILDIDVYSARVFNLDLIGNKKIF